MTDKYIFYEFEGERYKVPTENQQDFESKAPNAKIMLTFDGENYKVPLAELNSFVSKAGGAKNLTYSAFNEKKQYSPETSTERLFSISQPATSDEAVVSAPTEVASPISANQTPQAIASEANDDINQSKADDDKVTWWDTLTKGTGGMFAGVGARILDAAIQSTSGTMMNPRTGEYFKGVDYEDRINDMSDPIVRARHKASDTHERLSLAADPTGGQVGFFDLIKEGEFGMAMQKGLATTIESLPMTLAAANPYTMTLNAILMASENYANETLENPEVEGWKRMTYSVGTAALEQAVEKFADPVFKYLGGGKGAKAFTEDAAKELLENISKESVDNISKRILKKVGKVGKNLGKDMAGEGTEEIITSFGNDALGSALDAIEGNDDYGINAQWEAYKEQNPDATKEDFAKSKGKEYLDAFIGGALSSVYMSGTAQTVNEVAAPIRQNRVQNEIDNQRNEGAKKDYVDIYDVNDDVAEATRVVSDSFKDNEGNPTIGDEFIGTLSSEDAMALASRADISSEQRTALAQLAGRKAVQEGLDGKLNERLETEINANKVLMEHVTENETIVSGQHNGRLVYVVGGVANNGTITLADGNNGPVAIFDAMTGEQSIVRSEELSNATSNNANDVISFMEENYRGAEAKRREIFGNTMSPRAKFRAIQPYAGKKILVDVGNGITDVLVQEISPNGDVLIKGKKGDLGGQSILKLDAATFYDSIYRNDDGNPVITETEQGTEAQAAEPETIEQKPAESEITGEEDFRGYEGQIFINGALVDVTDAQQDNPSNTVNYTYVDESGNIRVGSTTIEGFANAVQQANAQNAQPAPAPTVNVEPEPQPQPQPQSTLQPTPNDNVVEVTVPTESINWDALLDQDPDAYFSEFQNRFGDKAERRLNAVIAATQNRLNKLDKENPQETEGIIANDELKELLENRLNTLRGLAARFAPAAESTTVPATEPVSEPVSETPTEPVPATEPVPSVEPATTTTPEPTTQEPTPAEVVLDNGYIVKDGKIVNPTIIEQPDVDGTSNRIFIAEKDGKWGAEVHVVMDDGNESGSHNETIQLENLSFNTKEEAIKDALKYMLYYKLNIKPSSPSSALDAFMQYVRNTYLPNPSDSQGNSVPLETEPTTGNDEGQGAAQQTGGAEGHGADTDSGRTDDGGSPESGSGDSQATSTRKGEGEGGDTGSQVDKYPARKGNATKRLLVDTFGLEKVTIPDSRKNILNSIYDFMMEMSKVLGISPKSIGQGGWLRVDNLRQNANASARHELRYRGMDTIESAHMKFKYGWLTGIAHEWWHALDHALSYFETGKGIYEASSVSDKRFTGRKEVLDAVRDVIRAIEKSGHPDRIRGFIHDRKSLGYYLSPTEMAARAFEEYINAKFVEQNIIIDGVRDIPTSTQPTIEEMDVIAPAFDHLFKVLQEKEGKTPGTSVLYHIGEMMEGGSESRQMATNAIMQALDNANFPVVLVSDEEVDQIVQSANPLMTPSGIVYGWTDGEKIYLTRYGINPNTPIHEYTHLWAEAMMRKNPEGWKSIKKLLKGTPVWDEVMNDPNYADIRNDEDAVASEALSRISGENGAARMEAMAEALIDKSKGTMRKLEAQGLIQRMKDALNMFWEFVWTDLFNIKRFRNVQQVADRVLYDLLNNTDLDLPNSGEATQITNANGDVIADTNENGKIRFSISTWRDGGREYLANWLAKDKTLTKQEKEDILARMDEFYENAVKYTDVYTPFGTWSEAAVKYDENGNPLMSVIKKNGDYSMNLDFSLVCKKRRPLNKLLRTLINRNAFGTYSLRERELAEINWILQEHGFEVACALCFVDSKRYRVTGVADVFAELYNKFVKALAPEGAQIAHFNYSNNPNIESVENGLDTLSDEQLNWDKFNELANQYEPTTVEGKVAKFLRENPSQRRLVDATDFIDAVGFEAVKEGNPALLSLYNSKKGTGGPKASFGDVQYLNDILKKSRSFTAGRAYDVGGVRLQSFSDFVPHMYFDYMQLFAELTAKKLPAHAYTKEMLFAKIFGLTGLKINMSLVPAVVEGGIAPGLDANGNYAWADAVKDKDGNIIQQAQSFPFDEAMAIQNAEGYSKNCGVIAVGISDEHIEKMLNDPNIPFIIPYHKSSLNAIVARMTNIDQYKDYTNVQNTKKADGTKLDEGAKDFNFNAWLRKNKGATPKDAAQAYLDWCKENNYRPKFSQFAYHPNYYKLLVDFNTVDARTGEYTPQGAVTMTFPTGDNAFGDVETLIQQGLQEDADLEEKMDSEIEEVANEVEQRLAEIKNEPEMSEKEYAEKMAQLADERTARIRERAEEGDGILSRSGDVTTEDIRNEKAAIKEKAIADGTFMKAPNGQPTNLTEDQWLTVRTESFKNWFGDWINDPKNASKVVDKNGEPQVVYHGSPYGAITEFDRRGHSVSGLREFGTYFSTSRELAQLYAYARQQAKGDVEKYEAEKYRLDAIIFNNDTPARVALDAFDELDRLEESQKPKVYEVFLNIREPKVFDAERSNGWDGWHKLKQDVGYDIKSGVEAIEAIAGHNRAARMNEQYDGIIAQNMADVHSDATEDLMGGVFLVFDETPEKIKSATSNIGTFEPNSPNIYYRSESNPITPEMDAEYIAAVEAGDMETAQRMVDEAARTAGYTERVYHGTPYFGFTEFESHRDSGAIFTTSARNVAANYGGNDKYASVRSINKGIKEAKTTQDVLDNAKSRFDQNWRMATQAERDTSINNIVTNSKKVLAKIQELNTDFSNFPFELQNALSWMESIIYDAAEGIENGNEGNSLSKMLKDGYERFKESRIEARSLIEKHYDEFTSEQKAYWSYINSFEVGDAAIDAGHTLARAVSDADLVTVDGRSFMLVDELNNITMQDSGVGAYRLYGDLGSNPLVVDAEHNAWYMLNYNGMTSTDSIAEWAKENGYTSVVFNDIYDYGDLSSVKVFYSSSQLKSADPVTYDDNGNVIPLSERFNPENPDIRYRREDIQNAAVDNLVGESRNRAIENAVNEEASKLGVNVTYKTRSEMPAGHTNDKGYYDTKTGEIVVCPENNASIADAIQTILHEAVAHKGLRELMGDRFNEFINRVYDSLDAETKAKVDALAESKYNGNTAVAMEEYMASLAETMDFENNSVWDKIKSIFNDIINAILGRNDIKIGDNELRYILRASYNNMSNPRNMETIQGWAQDQTMREEYGINEASPEILSRTGVTAESVARETARGTYDRVVNEDWQEFQRQFQDAMQPVRIAIEAIQQETGNIPIEDYENYILMQNQASSRSRVEIDDFARRYYSPIIKKVEEIIDRIIEARGGNIKNEKQRMYAYQELKNYLIAKHGLERNAYYQTRNTRKVSAKTKAERIKSVRKDHKDIVEQIKNDPNLSSAEKTNLIRQEKKRRDTLINQIRETDYELDLRDYSGLTALFGFIPEQYVEAEQEAEKLVDDFEAAVDTAGLWEKINAATDKTLRHSYESGLLSRQQYNDIKSMFQFYIPLRGFDETTAEDVYAYARFEGNRFNPAVQTAKGRTSVADDPIAIIMNMAESEIAQGNKNRAKQALYNFLLNRSEGKSSQNSLMQIESVWYYVDTDDSGKVTHRIAAPDHEAGETYEEFEARMAALEAEEKAVKSKKGKVNVGMRFQKQMNRNAHYVYLKVNGVDKAIYINGDPKAADAINGAYHKKPTYAEEVMRTFNRFVSSTFTNYSVEFTARNYFRDLLYSHLNVGIKESDPAYRKKFRQNWRHNNIGTMLRMLTAYRAGEYDGVALTEDQAAFVEFMKNGGQTGYTVINSVENHKRELESAIKRMQKGIEKGGVKDSAVFKYTLGMVELLNEASELVSRFAAFKTSRDMGRGINTAINDAKEITVNFNTKGAQDGTGWMGAIARYFGWSKFFFNASVQGVQNIKAMSQANKLKFGSVVGGIAAAGFMMPVITAALAEIFGYDDDDEYWNIPEYERQNNLCIMVGDKYAKIPLPIGFREVYAIGDMVAAMAFNKKFSRDFGQVGTDIANKIATTILPINPLESQANGLSLWHTGLYTALPSTLQFAIQNVSNVDWKGAPLQKEYTYNENDPQWMKAYASNPDWLKGLSKWCNEHINLDGDFEGMDWSPEKVDNTLSNMFGGIYSLIKKSGKSISMIWNEENRNLHNVPLAGVVIGSGAGVDDRFVNDAYYDMKEYYDENIGKIKRTAKAFGYDLGDVFEGDNKPGEHQPKMQRIYSNRNFDFMQEWYKGDKVLDSLKGKIDRREKKAAKMENPPMELLDEITNLRNQYETERREFVNDMLEFD